MATRTRTGPYTFADFLELIPEDQKADLLNGTIYISPPQSLDENRLVLWLATVLGIYVEERQLGALTLNKVVYHLSDLDGPEPDLAFVRTSRLHIRKTYYLDGPPDLAIEIVSPDSVDRDYEDKRERYEASGVEEYWIIDPDEHTATFLVRDGDHFVEVPVTDHIFRSRALRGFTLDVRWLWQRPLPLTLSIVQSLLK